MTDTISKQCFFSPVISCRKKGQNILNFCVFSKHSVLKGTLHVRKMKFNNIPKNGFSKQNSLTHWKWFDTLQLVQMTPWMLFLRLYIPECCLNYYNVNKVQWKKLYNLAIAHFHMPSLPVLQDNSVTLEFLKGVLKKMFPKANNLSIYC